MRRTREASAGGAAAARKDPRALAAALMAASRAARSGDVAFGSQIRSYVFQPYQKVIDLRTGVETSNIAAMMDGDIDGFIQGKLRGLKREKGAASDDE